MRRKGGKLLPVDHPLLLFRRKAVADHEGNFRAIQPHPFGTTLDGAVDVGHQAGVHLQGNADTVQGFCRFIAQLFQARLEIGLLGDDFFELLLELR